MSIDKARFLAILISALASMSTAAAETSQQSVVGLFKDVCVVPDMPTAVMAAGEKFAELRSGKLVFSGRMPIPFMHNENGPRVSLGSAWELDLPGTSGVKLIVSIVGPEISGVRHSACLIEIPVTEFFDEKLELEIERQFGASITKDLRVSQRWFFTQEKSAGNCGKQISITQHHTRLAGVGKSNALIFLDMAYPDNGQWIGALTGTRCQS